MGLLSKIFGKIDYLKRTIAVFYWYPSSKAETIEPYKYREAKDESSFLRTNYDSNSEECLKRIQEGHILCYWEDKEKVISYGWVNPTGKHLLGELNLDMDLHNTDILYDFHTSQEYRGRGLYPLLLRKICARNEKAKLIYAFPDNHSSIKGIKKAGFKFAGNLRGFNKNKYHKLINNAKNNL